MNNQRRNYFIDKTFQAKFILKFCVIVIVASLAIGGLLLLLASNSTTVAIENTKVTVKTTADFIFPFLIQTLLVVTAFSAISVVFLTLFVSHKIAGPLYRLKKEIEKVSEGNLAANFQIRTNDQLKNLAMSLTTMSGYLKDKITSLKKEINELNKAVEKFPSDNKQNIEAELKIIESIINNFKGV
ncbi:MAG: hypothetical protein WC412_06190 [Candidatus Omnitrophota bacterium]|jgi:methyl-accepting chemotaxis protein